MHTSSHLWQAEEKAEREKLMLYKETFNQREVKDNRPPFIHFWKNFPGSVKGDGLSL